MKKHYLFETLLLVSLAQSTILISAERPIKAEIAQIKKENSHREPTAVKKISTIEKAVKILDQKAFCLLTGKKCSPRDRLIVNYALGFAVATTSDIYSIARILKSRKIIDKGWQFTASQFASESALRAAKLKGAFLTPFTTAIQHAIVSALFLIGNVATAVEKSIQAESVITFLKEISIYLAQDVRCIWSESYCKVYGEDLLPQIFGEQSIASVKREALYFWMGFLSGITAKKVSQTPFGQKAQVFVQTLPAQLKERTFVAPWNRPKPTQPIEEEEEITVIE